MFDAHNATLDSARTRAWVEVDLDAVALNTRQLNRLLSPQTQLMAVVKADGYGHGAVAVAREVVRNGARWLGVATVSEAIELRDAGIDEPILIFGAVRDRHEVRQLVHYRLCPTICDVDHGRDVSDKLGDLEKPLEVHLKLDTGMSRLGTLASNATRFWQAITLCRQLTVSGIYSHLATAECLDESTTQQQYNRFTAALNSLPSANRSVIIHLANSAALLRFPRTHFDLVRVGLAIYGLSPMPPSLAEVSLYPVLQVKARVTQVKDVEQGAGISYGHQFRAPQGMRVGTIAIGYADGVSRSLSDQIEVLVNGIRARQVGAITMDQLMIDVTEIPSVRPGDIVTLIGRDKSEQIKAEEWARASGTIVWEVLCGFKNRLPRVTMRDPQMIARSNLADCPLTLPDKDLRHACTT